jgi:hypothetical protein
MQPAYLSLPIPAFRTDVHVCSRTFKAGRTEYNILWQSKYWIANQFEWELICNGADPDELGMFPFEPDEDPL